MTALALALALAAEAAPPEPAAPPEVTDTEPPPSETPAFEGAPPIEGDRSGFFARAELGTLLLTGEAGSFATPGPAAAAAVGWAPWELLELGGFAAGGLASADEGVGPPPPGAVQLRAVGADGRLAVSVLRVRATAGGGFAWLSLGPNRLLGVEGFGGEKLVPAAAASLEWLPHHPRFTAGVAGRWLHDAAAPGSAALLLAATLRASF